MTPQLQMAIRLLQLPVLDLQAELREALENNLMLEMDDGLELASLAEVFSHDGRPELLLSHAASAAQGCCVVVPATVSRRSRPMPPSPRMM